MIEFDSAFSAVRFIENTKSTSGPGSPQAQLACTLVDSGLPPITPALIARTPLTLDREPLPKTYDGSIRMAATNAYSGRSVVLSGFPASIPPRRILDKLSEEDYQVVNAPTFLSDARPSDELVPIEVEKR